MIQSASFRNFKSLRHVDVDFERLTVFVGPNASGKTSILEGLHLMWPGEFWSLVGEQWVANGQGREGR
jgi:recombinational DNA repair ATPase RecF